MYDRVRYPLNGKWARHVMRMAEITGTPIDSRVREVAGTYSYNRDELPNALQFSNREYDALQYVLDWNARCVLLETTNVSYTKHIAVLGAQLMGSKRIGVYVKDYHDVGIWNKLLTNFCPDDAILIRPNDPKKSLENVTDNDVETAPRVWIVDRWQMARDTSVVTEYKIDHIIVGRGKCDFSYDVSDSIEALCGEIPRATIIMETTEFWQNLGDYQNQATIGYISSLVTGYLKLHLTVASIPLVFTSFTDIAISFRSRGRKFQPVRLFEASGVCFNLVMDRTYKDFKILQSNSMLVDSGDHSNRRSEIITGYRKQQARAVADYGATIDEIVDHALDGSTHAQQTLDGLKSAHWARLKSQMLTGLVKDFKATKEKAILVTKDENIRKYLMLSLGATYVSPKELDQEKHKKYANFVYPAEAYKDFEHLPMAFKPNYNALMVTDDFIGLPGEVISQTHHVVLCEFPYSGAEVGDFVELSKAFNFTLHFGLMRGTFEEKLSQRVLTGYY